MRLNFFLYRICPDGFVLSMEKKGGHIQNHPKKRFTNVIKLFLQKSYSWYKNHWVIHRNIS